MSARNVEQAQAANAPRIDDASEQNVPRSDEAGESAAQLEESTELRVQLQLRSNFVWIGQEASTQASEDSQVNGIASSQFVQQLGFGAYISFNDFGGIAPSLDIYVDEYVYLSSFSRAFITQMHTGSETGDVASVLSLAINLPWLMSIPLGDGVSYFNFALGLSFNFRIPAVGIDGTSNLSSLSDFLLGDGRWFFLYVEPSFAFHLGEYMGFSLGFKAQLPVWHAWDRLDLEFFDHMELGLIVGVSVFL